MKDENHKLQIYNESGLNLPIEVSDILPVLAQIEAQENSNFSFIELVYVDEDEIVRINKEHLQRDYITDIISFRYDDDSNLAIEGTLFCCASRILEQAGEFGESEKKEFLRIVTHGILHLVGYDDSSEAEKTAMTELENKYLAYADV